MNIVDRTNKPRTSAFKEKPSLGEIMRLQKQKPHDEMNTIVANLLLNMTRYIAINIAP